MLFREPFFFRRSHTSSQNWLGFLGGEAIRFLHDVRLEIFYTTAHNGHAVKGLTTYYRPGAKKKKQNRQKIEKLEQMIRTDSGAELRGVALDKWVLKEGIAGRTIMDMARWTITRKNIPDHLWPEVVCT